MEPLQDHRAGIDKLGRRKLRLRVQSLKASGQRPWVRDIRLLRAHHSRPFAHLLLGSYMGKKGTQQAPWRGGGQQDGSSPSTWCYWHGSWRTRATEDAKTDRRSRSFPAIDTCRQELGRRARWLWEAPLPEPRRGSCRSFCEGLAAFAQPSEEERSEAAEDPDGPAYACLTMAGVPGATSAGLPHPEASFPSGHSQAISEHDNSCWSRSRMPYKAEAPASSLRRLRLQQTWPLGTS